MKYTLPELSRMIDHTNLKTDAKVADMEKLCSEAKMYNFAMVAINQVQSANCARLLKGSDVEVGAAIAFPLGQTSIESKIFETANALENGATEIDYVIHVGMVKDGNWDYIKKEMQGIVDICKKNNVISKVIFENHYLTTEEKIKLCEIANEVKPDFIKTSTGMAPTGATEQDIALMRKHANDEIQVKASGGVRNADLFLAMLKNGATRVGTSSGISIINEIKERYFNDNQEFLEL